MDYEQWIWYLMEIGKEYHYGFKAKSKSGGSNTNGGSHQYYHTLRMNKL